jgi:hypothetical protein
MFQCFISYRRRNKRRRIISKGNYIADYILIKCYLKKMLFDFLIIYYHSQFQDSVLRSASVAHTSEVCVSAILLLPSVNKMKTHEHMLAPSGVRFVPSFVKFGEMVRKLNDGNKDTDGIMIS